MKPLTKDALKSAGVEIEHFFSKKSPWYLKISHIKAGAELTKHTHSYDHPSILLSGIAYLYIGEQEKIIEGPKMLKVSAGVEHRVKALTDLVWICAHETDDKNPETVDVSLMSKRV